MKKVPLKKKVPVKDRKRSKIVRDFFFPVKISKKCHFWTPFETFLLSMDLLLHFRLLPQKQSLR